MAALAPATGSIDWLHEFRAFSVQHLVVVAVCLAVMVVVPLVGRRQHQPGAGGDRRLRQFLGWGTLAWQALINAWWIFVAPEGAGDPLPLHVCDIAAVLAGVSMLTDRPGMRWATTLVYFWGVALSTQAFITPVLSKGMASPAFWSFWVGHTQIVGIAIYHVVALGYRPRLRDLAMIGALNTGYLGVALLANWLLDANYGYIGNSNPDKPTLIDALGPWPGRIVWMLLIANAACVAAWIPWALGDRRKRQRNAG